MVTVMVMVLRKRPEDDDGDGGDFSMVEPCPSSDWTLLLYSGVSSHF